jgi:hypothetical protein
MRVPNSPLQGVTTLPGNHLLEWPSCVYSVLRNYLNPTVRSLKKLTFEI